MIDLRASPGDSVAAAEVVPLCVLTVLMVSSSVLPAAYEATGRAYPDGLAILEYLAWGCAAWAWLFAYCSRHRLSLPVDAGWFVFLAWGIVLPYYLFRARERRAWIPIAAFVALWLVGQAVSAVVLNLG